MSIPPTLNLSLIQQLTMVVAGAKAGLPVEPLVALVESEAGPLPPEATTLLQRMGEDLHALQQGGGALSPILREMTNALDHQLRNAHNVASLNLQAGEMELGTIATVLAAMGDRQGLVALEEARARLKTAREGILRASAFLDVLGGLSECATERELQLKIAGLMAWQPDAAAASVATPAPRQAVPSASSSGGRVSLLYVEDDADSAEMIMMFLGRLDFIGRILQADSYAGALAVFSDEPTISLLLTDHHIIGMETGVDLARELKRRKPDLRTAFLSANIDQLKEELTREEKENSLFMLKPVDLDDLGAHLRSLAFGTPAPLQ